MAKQQAGEDAPRRRGKSDRAKEASPEEAASFFDLSLWPEVPEESRPRRAIFDTLHDQDVRALKQRGYDVVLLRLLPRRSDVEDQQYLIMLMQGVSDGTVALSKGRSEALTAELRSRQLGGKKELKRIDAAGRTDDVKQILAWQETRHRFTDNTTMVAPEEVKAFFQRVMEANAKAAAEKQKRKASK